MLYNKWITKNCLPHSWTDSQAAHTHTQLNTPCPKIRWIVRKGKKATVNRTSLHFFEIFLCHVTCDFFLYFKTYHKNDHDIISLSCVTHQLKWHESFPGWTCADYSFIWLILPASPTGGTGMGTQIRIHIIHWQEVKTPSGRLKSSSSSLFFPPEASSVQHAASITAALWGFTFSTTHNVQTLKHTRRQLCNVALLNRPRETEDADSDEEFEMSNKRILLCLEFKASSTIF